MDIKVTQKAIDAVAEHGADAIAAILSKLKEERQAAAVETQKAVDAYFADVAKRETALKEKVNELNGQKEALASKIKSMEPMLVNATISGDSEALTKVQGVIADIEAQKAAVAAQIELLCNACVPGSKELLDAVEAKEKTLGEVCAVEFTIQQQIKAIAEHEHNVWGKILHDLLYAGTSGCNAYKAHEHFSCGGNPVKIEPKEPEGEFPGTNLCTGSYRFGGAPAGDGSGSGPA